MKPIIFSEFSILFLDLIYILNILDEKLRKKNLKKTLTINRGKSIHICFIYYNDDSGRFY